MSDINFNAVVLAGDRGSDDPLLKAANVSAKAEVRLGNSTQLERVLLALHEAKHINHIFVVGPNSDQVHDNEKLGSLLNKYHAVDVPMAEGPSASAIAGVSRSNSFPALIITCDLPLVQAEHIDEYCRQVANTNADFVIGAVNHSEIVAFVPEIRKTIYRFRQDAICFANVFALMNQPGMKALEFWRQMEKLRKSPLQIIAKLGWRNIVSYKLRRMSLRSVADILSARVKADVEVKKIVLPQLAIDVDSKEDYELMQDFLREN